MENRSYLAKDDSESDDSDSPQENPDYATDEDFNPKPKLKNKVSKLKIDFVEEDSDSQEKNSDSEEEKPKLKNKVSKHKTKKLTEYEMLVQKNKKEKLAFLDSLKIDEIKESFAEAVKSLKPKRKKREKRPRSPITRRKFQHRSVKIEKDLSEEALEAQALSKAYELAVKKTVTRKKTVTVKKITLPKGLRFKNALLGDRSYNDFTKDFSDLNKGNTDPFYGYASHFQNMLLLKAPIPIFDNSTLFSLAFHPIREKLILASAVTKNGKLSFLNVNSDSNPFVFEPHADGITHLKFNPEHFHLIVSSSYDGTLKCGDLVKGVFTEMYKVLNPRAAASIYFDFLSPNSVLLGQRNGSVVTVDYRSKEKSILTHKCYRTQVKSVSVHPVDKNYFISSETKGTVSLWDLRQLKTEPIAHVNHLCRDLQLALFSPLTGKSVLVSCNGKICLYDSYVGSCLIYQRCIESELSRSAAKEKISRAMWLPNTDNAFVVGSNGLPRRIQIYNDRCINIYNFRHEKLDFFTPIHIFHPSLPVLAGATANGKVFVIGVS